LLQESVLADVDKLAEDTGTVNVFFEEAGSWECPVGIMMTSNHV
jgi:hypothetical protein